MDAGRRAWLASRVVEVFGAIQITFGVLVGALLMIFSPRTCYEWYGDRCVKMSILPYLSEQFYAGMYVLFVGLVTGSMFVMLGAYVSFKTSSKQAANSSV